jgi:hypothetical protein
MWMALNEILLQPVKPELVAQIVIDAQTRGWPEPPLVLHEEQ